MAKKRQKGFDLNKVTLTFIEENYISYEECLKSLFMKKPTLQQHMREGKKFTAPGDTLLLPNGRRVFLREAVQKELLNIFHNNGIR